MSMMCVSIFLEFWARDSKNVFFASGSQTPHFTPFSPTLHTLHPKPCTPKNTLHTLHPPQFKTLTAHLKLLRRPESGAAAGWDEAANTLRLHHSEADDEASVQSRRVFRGLHAATRATRTSRSRTARRCSCRSA